MYNYHCILITANPALFLLQEGWSKVTGVGGPYITKGNQWVGYDDVEAVTEKVRHLSSGHSVEKMKFKSYSGPPDVKRLHQPLTAPSLLFQAQYAVDEGLGGVMVWDLPSDDFGNLCGYGENPLLTAIATTLDITSVLPPGSSTSPSSPPPPLGGDDTDNLVKDNDISDRGNTGADRRDRKQGRWPNQSASRDPGTQTNGSGGNDENLTSNLLYPWQSWLVLIVNVKDTS